jgi:hypothetical protein
LINKGDDDEDDIYIAYEDAIGKTAIILFPATGDIYICLEDKSEVVCFTEKYWSYDSDANGYHAIVLDCLADDIKSLIKINNDDGSSKTQSNWSDGSKMLIQVLVLNHDGTRKHETVK